VSDWLAQVTFTRPLPDRRSMVDDSRAGLTRPWCDIASLRVTVEVSAVSAADAGFTAVSAVLSALDPALPEQFAVSGLEVTGGG
jgi:hypothetical protein